MLRSRYAVIGSSGRVGYAELSDLRAADGSRTCLVRERLEFWGPVLDRFVVLTFNPAGEFDTGHWVGTSEYSGDFRYSFFYDGRAIRGDWQGSALGRCWNHVPAGREDPLLGFWGPLESLVLERFDPFGSPRQVFRAIDVEDTHHRAMPIVVEKIGREQIDVPAGRFWATRYRTERFGETHHWVDDKGVVLRWVSEGGEYRWDLELYPAENLPLPSLETVANGTYKVFSSGAGPTGELSWQIGVDAEGKTYVTAEERLDRRVSRFRCVLGAEGEWKSSSHECDWIVPEGAGLHETHYFETFFHREQVYLLRVRPNAYPLLQSQPISRPPSYHLVNVPIASLAWLRRIPAGPAGEQPLTDFIHLANRYRGACMESPRGATVSYSRDSVDFQKAGGGTVRLDHHFWLSYPGGWLNSTFECWTDDHLIPWKAVVQAAEGPITYEMAECNLSLTDRLPQLLGTPL